MKPEQPSAYFQTDFTRPCLLQIIDNRHPLVVLGGQIDWPAFDQSLGKTYHPGNGAPALPTRLMVALHYLKYQHDLSDAATIELWKQNPYWQHFSGAHFFQHEAPCDSSSMTRWRSRLGAAGAEDMLKQTIQTGLKTGAIQPKQLERANLDTTVQTKNVRFPTDSRLYDRARERLVNAARAEGLRVKQSFHRVGPRLLKEQSRLARSRKFVQVRACVRKLHTCLGRVIRQIEGQKFTPGGALAKLLATAKRIHTQRRQDTDKIYSVHAPEVRCIAKGKAGRPYEFGSKASVATTSQGCWLIGALNFADNPYDGHTAAKQLEQVRRLVGDTVKEAHVDMGYRGHDYEGAIRVHVASRRRGEIPKSLWKRMKRRAAIEPVIGHLKAGHRLDRNRLKGSVGDSVNLLLSAAAMNFSKLLGFVCALFCHLLTLWKTAFTPHLGQGSMTAKIA